MAIYGAASSSRSKSKKMTYSYEFPRPSVTVDTVVLDLKDRDQIPRVLLVKRKNEPFKGMWAIPGGFLDINEDLADGAARELLEETSVGVFPTSLRQFHVAGELGRDPRGRVISVVFAVSINRHQHMIKAGDDAQDVNWFKITELPQLAADHRSIISRALHIRGL